MSKLYRLQKKSTREVLFSLLGGVYTSFYQEVASEQNGHGGKAHVPGYC